MISDRVKRNLDWRLIVLALVLFAAFTAATAATLPTPIDWRTAFRPAARSLLFTGNPYVEGYFNPPWAAIPMIPFALLPERVGGAAMLILGLVGFAYAASKLGARPLLVGAFLLSPPVLHCLINGNIDWIVLLGFVMPPQIGLFFVLVKPQMGAIVALYWLVEAWREGGFKEVLRVFWPVGAALALSFILYGLWPLRSSVEVDLWWNASLWPASIPVGLALFVSAIRKRRIQYAMGAAPCLSPYVLLHAWSGALAAVLANEAEALAAIAGLWVLVAIRAFG